jgi:hypothetical protein
MIKQIRHEMLLIGFAFSDYDLPVQLAKPE